MILFPVIGVDSSRISEGCYFILQPEIIRYTFQVEILLSRSFAIFWGRRCFTLRIELPGNEGIELLLQSRPDRGRVSVSSFHVHVYSTEQL